MLQHKKDAQFMHGKVSFLTTSMIVHTQNAKGPADQSVIQTWHTRLTRFYLQQWIIEKFHFK